VKILRWILGTAVVLCMLPFLSGVLSGGVAHALGCQLDEASQHSCRLWGAEIGGVLSFMFVFTWISLITFPAIAIIGVVWLVVEVVNLAIRRRASS